MLKANNTLYFFIIIATSLFYYSVAQVDDVIATSAPHETNTLTIQHLNIVDNRGNLRVKIGTENNISSVSLYDENGFERVKLTASVQNSHVQVASRQGLGLLDFSVEDFRGASFSIKDLKGTERILLNHNHQNSNMIINDEIGIKRAELSYKDSNPTFSINDKNENSCIRAKHSDYYGTQLELQCPGKPGRLYMNADNYGTGISMSKKENKNNDLPIYSGLNISYTWNGYSSIAIRDKSGREQAYFGIDKEKGAGIFLAPDLNQSGKIGVFNANNTYSAIGILKSNKPFLSIWQDNEELVTMPTNK